MFKVKKIKRTWFICIGFAFFPQNCWGSFVYKKRSGADLKRQLPSLDVGHCESSLADFKHTWQGWRQFIADRCFSHCLESLAGLFQEGHRARGRGREHSEGIVCPPRPALPLTQQPWNEMPYMWNWEMYSFISPFTPHVTHPPRLMMVTSNRKQKRLKLCF